MSQLNDAIADYCINHRVEGTKVVGELEKGGQKKTLGTFASKKEAEAALSEYWAEKNDFESRY